MYSLTRVGDALFTGRKKANRNSQRNKKQTFLGAAAAASSPLPAPVTGADAFRWRLDGSLVVLTKHETSTVEAQIGCCGALPPSTLPLVDRVLTPDLLWATPTGTMSGADRPPRHHPRRQVNVLL